MHNILFGIYERAKLTNSIVIGFIGSDGLLNNKYITINDDAMNMFLNQGGCDMIGKSISSQILLKHENKQKLLKTIRFHQLDGLILPGGCQTMNTTLILSEFITSQNLPTCIIGVPATSSNNLEHPLVEMSVGYDTATRIYSSLIGNILTDAESMPKYWHFIRLMGKEPSFEVKK